MPTQRTSGISWSEEISIPSGIFVASGYDLRISVWRGRLRVEDGVGKQRRRLLLHRATSRLKRLLVLGHTGFISLEAIRWLADVRASFVQIDADGRVLAAFGPPGTDRPSLRRAQALASATDAALELSRWLVDAKLGAQRATLQRFADLTLVDAGLATIAAHQDALSAVATIDELRVHESWAAGAYWQTLAPLPVRFARRDADLVPRHWRTVGGRSSPLANGPRLAANPANAVLNYCCALLESEAMLAARTVGLDPGLGVMHVDQVYRDSLAADLMEPVRPSVDRYVIELLTGRPFAARDFFETRAGVCRVTAPLTHELAGTIPHWRQLVGRVAEDFAARLDPSGREPGRTPISRRRQAEARPTGPRHAAPTSLPRGRACSWCGGPTAAGRKTCSTTCRLKVQEQDERRFVEAGSQLQRERWAAGAHPTQTAEAKSRLGATQRTRRAAAATWDREHPEHADRERFSREVVPLLGSISARRLARATGLSVGYCAAIKRGERVPHPRWWQQLSALSSSSNQHP